MYIPKDESEQDGSEIVSSAADTRRIGFKNKDNEVICASRNIKMRRLTTERSCIEASCQGAS